MIVFRLTLAKYVDTAFTGEGARRVGSRWTPIGYPAVYAASSVALAVLETLVHADLSVMPSHRVIQVDIPDTLAITTIEDPTLPLNWRETPPAAALQSIGKAWLDAAETAVLKVPSVIVPQEFNYLLNPGHPDFKQLSIGTGSTFDIDPRLLES